MNQPPCTDEVCVTCSDQLLEVLVTGVDESLGVARGTCGGTACEVSIELVDGVSTGDHLLVHGGVALQRGTLEGAR